MVKRPGNSLGPASAILAQVEVVGHEREALPLYLGQERALPKMRHVQAACGPAIAAGVAGNETALTAGQVQRGASREVNQMLASIEVISIERLEIMDQVTVTE